MPDSREPLASAPQRGAVTPLSPELTGFADALTDHYAIERPLGQGGMASVFLAHDRKHGRHVAVKVVHPQLSAALGRERFLAEIRTTAKLQHPHILPLLDSGDAGGLLYYVMPHVEGDSLRERLTREKQLPLEDAVRIACEVADALGYAHEHGIIHRDIKPENILLQGGHALVADFGIALAVQEAGGPRLTQTGLSLGTPQYMSPEQAMGERTIDARSDVYALGAVTYEMLTGEPPFTGASVQGIVAKVLTEKPVAPSVIRDTVPPHVEHAVLRALAKLPADRWATTRRFADAIMPGESARGIAARGPSSAGALTDAEPRQRSVRGVRGVARAIDARALAAAVVVVAASLAFAWWLGRRLATPAPAWSAFTQLTDASGVETSSSLAPNGESFAYASNARGTWDIYVQRLGGRNPTLVAGDSTDEVWPAYSPDGKEITFAKRGIGIFVMGATGESPRRLSTFGSNPTWSPDGRSIALGSEEVTTPYAVDVTGALWRVDAAGGTPRRLETPAGRDAYQPAWSPSGARIAFWSASGGQRDIETIPAAGGPRVKVTDDAATDWAPEWSADGRFLYFASDRGGTMGIWRIAVDEASGRPEGAPEQLVAGVDAAMDLPHVSRDGTMLLFRSKLESVNPVAIGFDAASARVTSVTLLQHRTGLLVPTDVSPDGEWLALYNLFEPQEDIFIMRRDGTALTRLTNDAARDRWPRFTPDGKALTFYSNAGGRWQTWSIHVDGSGGRTPLTDFARGTVFGMFAPDGKRLLTGAWIGTGPWPLTERNATELPGRTAGDTVFSAVGWSRDGRKISGYLLAPSKGFRGLGVYDVAAQRVQLLTGDTEMDEVAWLPYSRHVVYMTRRGRLVMQDVVSLALREISGVLPYPQQIRSRVIASPDGRTLYYGASQVEANIWMVTQPRLTPKR